MKPFDHAASSAWETFYSSIWTWQNSTLPRVDFPPLNILECCLRLLQQSLAFSFPLSYSTLSCPWDLHKSQMVLCLKLFSRSQPNSLKCKSLSTLYKTFSHLSCFHLSCLTPLPSYATYNSDILNSLHFQSRTHFLSIQESYMCAPSSWHVLPRNWQVTPTPLKSSSNNLFLNVLTLSFIQNKSVTIPVLFP